MIELKDLEKALNKDGFIVSKIKGNSMLPVLNQKIDSVVISKVNRDIKKYDVVLYKVKEKYILHRVIDVSKNKLIIRGDNCLNNEYVSVDDVLGLLTAYYHNGSYIEITEEFNKRCFNRSNSSLLFRKLKYNISKLLKKNRNYE